VVVETATSDMPFRSATVWQVVTSGNPIGAQLVAGLTEAQATEARQVLDGMLRRTLGRQPRGRAAHNDQHRHRHGVTKGSVTRGGHRWHAWDSTRS
jgi:hypothetical protein